MTSYVSLCLNFLSAKQIALQATEFVLIQDEVHNQLATHKGMLTYAYLTVFTPHPPVGYTETWRTTIRQIDK